MVKIHLSELLGKKKWSRADLSKTTGIRYNTINDLYYEVSERISFDHIDKICEALGCTVQDLIEYISRKKD